MKNICESYYPDNLIGEISAAFGGKVTENEIMTALSAMTERQNESVKRRYEKKMFYREIAAVYGTTRQYECAFECKTEKEIAHRIKEERKLSEKYRLIESNDAPIEMLKLKARAYNFIMRCGCRTVGDVLKMMDGIKDGTVRTRQIGRKTLDEISEKLEKFQEGWSK